MNYHRRTPWYRLLVYGALLALPVGGVVIATSEENAAGGVAAIVVALAFLVYHVVGEATVRIDARLSRLLGNRDLRKLTAFAKSFPGYRYVDVFRAAERFAASGGGRAVVVESHHDEDLNAIVNSQFYADANARLKPPRMAPRDVAYHEEHFFPSDRFWALPGRTDGIAILRVRTNDYSGEVILEMAAESAEAAERATEAIVEDSIAHSIYKNQLLEIAFEPGVNDYGEVESNGPIRLGFKKPVTVTAEDIILEDEIKETLDRNVFRFHESRELLARHGVPLKKGLLFYGPPGTGKTFTCQYIYANSAEVTTIVATGHTMQQIKPICAIARMLKPSLVVLEDVDLVFAAREINLYSSALGDLMDEMDGFQSDDPITFLLTTNALDRVEAAIKDRPGRINQVIYFGPPNADLRKQYVERYLRPYDGSGLDLDAIVRMTKGASQAFIKELIFRAVQVRLERSGAVAANANGTPPKLEDDDFETAIAELTRFGEDATSSIMGFNPGASD